MLFDELCTHMKKTVSPSDGCTMSSLAWRCCLNTFILFVLFYVGVICVGGVLFWELGTHQWCHLPWSEELNFQANT
jgi:hypothetical protein